MGWSRWSTGTLVVGVSATLLAVAPARADRPVTPRVPVILEQIATLTTHDPGMPTSTEPGRRIAQADVKVQPNAATEDDGPIWFYQAVVQLEGVPSREYDDALIWVAFGRLSDSTCVADTYDTVTTLGRYGESSYTIDSYIEDAQVPAQNWDCVSVQVTDLADTLFYDAMTAPLVNTLGEPALKLTAPKKAGLVTGVWTAVDLKVANSGQVNAEDVRITGSGKGVKTKPVTVDLVRADGKSVDVEVMVKLSAKGERTLTLRASVGDTSGTDKVTVRSVAPPPPPVSGTYRTTKGDHASFRIAGRKVKDFAVRLRVRCGIAPEPYTYTTGTYDFPTATVARNGIVDADDHGTGYGTGLEMLVNGAKITGSFFYSGPDGCFGTAGFTARRR
jgi:hypothetical protein